MKFAALLTSAGINIGLCVLFFSLYSVLRKQPGYAYVYFGRKLAQERRRRQDTFSLDRFVPSPSWIMKAWQCTEDEILLFAGLDAVVFLRMICFSIQIFSIATSVCIFGVLPMNYFGQKVQDDDIPSASSDVFTIAEIKDGLKWLWVHCLALYIITCSACSLLYCEYKSISGMRLAHITRSTPHPSHFAVLLCAIPRLADETLSESIKSFFTTYYGSSYLSHQMIYQPGEVQKFKYTGGKEFMNLAFFEVANSGRNCISSTYRCCHCGKMSNSFRLHHDNHKLDVKQTSLNHSIMGRKIRKECSAAIVFFKTRYAAYVASEVLQSSNPMMWVTTLAPEPHDMYWSNLRIPYKQLWVRRTAIFIASVAFVLVFFAPVTLVQGLTQLDLLKQKFPFLKSTLEKTLMTQLLTGYLPSVILQLFLYAVPPVMFLFSTLEGSISRSSRKRSACLKVLYFFVWNVFFVNIFSGSVFNQLQTISDLNLKEIPHYLATEVPTQATFYITFVLTLGWASLSSEIVQPFTLIYYFVRKYVLRYEDDLDSVPSFPYHTEVPRVLLFGLLGFTCAVLAPLILPFLLVYFFLAYLVYRNQILNVYSLKYESGGLLWPIVHNTTIFSLVLAQTIAAGIFGMKNSPVAVGLTILLGIFTLLFNEYCRQRFSPLFHSFSAQDLIDMDKADEESGRMEEIHQQVRAAYRQCAPRAAHDICDCIPIIAAAGQQAVLKN